MKFLGRFQGKTLFPLISHYSRKDHIFCRKGPVFPPFCWDSFLHHSNHTIDTLKPKLQTFFFAYILVSDRLSSCFSIPFKRLTALVVSPTLVLFKISSIWYFPTSFTSTSILVELYASLWAQCSMLAPNGCPPICKPALLGWSRIRSNTKQENYRQLTDNLTKIPLIAWRLCCPLSTSVLQFTVDHTGAKFFSPPV